MFGPTPTEAAATVVRWFPRTLITLALLASAITWNTPYFQLILSWSLLVLLIGMTVMAAKPSTRRLSATMSPGGFAAMVLAIEAGFLLLLVPVWLLSSPSSIGDIPGWTYPFLDKRWLIALYGVGVVTFLFLPVALRRLFPDDDEAIAPAAIEPAQHWLARLAGLVVVVALAWLIAGPPWNLARHHRHIDYHEQVHLGPLQAISKGYVPFVGPASTQYGPGSQWLTYQFMTRVSDFTIVGYREANLAIHLATTLAVGLLAWWLIDGASAVLVLVLAAAYSPLRLFYPHPDATFWGFYGWGNGFRYLGALLVVPALGLVASRARGFRLAWQVIALGVTWGTFAWVSQENLTSTLTSGGLVLLILGFTRTTPWLTLAGVAAGVIAGFGAAWLPILGYYAAHGEAGAFVANYFRVAGAVAMGFSNTWWSGSTTSPQYVAFRFTPLVFIGVGVMTLWHLPTLRLRGPLTAGQVRLFAFVAVLAACYLTALYRSDAPHLMNTLIALPFVLALAFRDLPAWSAESWAGRLALRVAVVVVAAWIYPIAPVLTNPYVSVIKTSLVRFQAEATPLPADTDPRVPFRRATAGLSDEPGAMEYLNGVPMRQFLEEMTEIKTLVGDRRTFVSGMAVPYTGLVYFIGDLTPAHYLLERETMTINSLLEKQVLADLHSRIRDVECVMARELESEEAKMFLEAYPGATIERRMLAGAPVFVLLAPHSPR